MDKVSLRKQIRQQRRALSAAFQQEAAFAIAEHIRQSYLFRRSQRIAAYMSALGEADVSPLLEHAQKRKKETFLPVIKRNTMQFHRYQSNSVMINNQYGILEPHPRKNAKVRCYILDLVLLPLVAFDEQGNRLGQGGGYYDRYFSFLRHRKSWHRPLLIGVAYEFQKQDALPADPWDVPLQGIVTEAGLRLFRRK